MFLMLCLYILLALHVLFLIVCIRLWLNGGVCTSEARLDDKTVLITGANTGIGLETAVDLAERGAKVVIACRDTTKGELALHQIKTRSGNQNVFLKKLDLASLESIRSFTKSFLNQFEALHILINNAGVMLCPYLKTEDGFESQFGVNHLGHFALTNLLLPRLVSSAPSRIINVSSLAHTFPGSTIKFDDINSEISYNSMLAYTQSKLANVIFTKELHRKLGDSGATCYSLHPGCVCTDLYRHVLIGKIFNSVVGLIVGKTPEQGAQTSIYCAVQEGIENDSGKYFSDCAVARSSKQSYDIGLGKKLWDLSESMTGVTFNLDKLT